jgi:hypothetical protein
VHLVSFFLSSDWVVANRTLEVKEREGDAEEQLAREPPAEDVLLLRFARVDGQHHDLLDELGRKDSLGVLEGSKSGRRWAIAREYKELVLTSPVISRALRLRSAILHERSEIGRDEMRVEEEGRRGESGKVQRALRMTEQVLSDLRSRAVPSLDAPMRVEEWEAD